MAFQIASALFAAALAQSAISQPLVATEGDAAPMRLHIGDTGIRCVRLPCPSRGVFLPREPANGVREGLLYSDMEGNSPPPPMIGDKALLSAVSQAWEERTCLAIDGRLISGVEDKPVLRVDRIVGPCRDHADPASVG